MWVFSYIALEFFQIRFYAGRNQFLYGSTPCQTFSYHGARDIASSCGTTLYYFKTRQ